MGKKTVFTNITPLPPNVSREIAIAMLHDHNEMIELNPLVIEHHPVKTPRDAPKDEFHDCAWHEITDRISYLPGGMMKGKVTYKGCFHNLPNGLQTHVYAPMNLDIREKWSVCGTLPGEPEEPRELGVNTPRTGLYLREDGEMKCNILMSNFVRKNLDNAHKVLVERILLKAERVQTHIDYHRTVSRNASEAGSLRDESMPPFRPGSHMGNLVRQMSGTPSSASASPADSYYNRPTQFRTSSDSAAVRVARTQLSSRDQNQDMMVQELPASQPGNAEGSIQPTTWTEGDPEEMHTVHPALREQYRQNLKQGTKAKPPTSGKTFAVELEGSRPESRASNAPSVSSRTRQMGPVELDGGFTSPPSTYNASKDWPTQDAPVRNATLPEMPIPQQQQHGGLGLAHMRSYSQPLIEADTFINSASGAHNMEDETSAISAHSAVSGVSGIVAHHSRFRGLSNSGPSPDRLTNNADHQFVAHNQSHIDPVSHNGNSHYPKNNEVINTTNATADRMENNPDRYSVVSDMTEMPTPRAQQSSFDNRYSIVSALSDGVPTPKASTGPGFPPQSRQPQQQWNYTDPAPMNNRTYTEQERDWEMQRRNFI